MEHLEHNSEEENLYNQWVANQYGTWLNKIHSDLVQILDDGQIMELYDSVGELQKIAAMHQNKKICQSSGCGATYPSNKQKCDICEQKLPNIKEMENVYTDKCEEIRRTFPNSPIPIETPDYDYLPNPGAAEPYFVPNIVLGEPIFKAPNSYNNLAEIMRIYGRQLGIRRYKTCGIRYFAWVCVDGQPYVLLSHLQRETLYCCACDKGFFGPKSGDGLEMYLKHCLQLHQNANPRLEYEFDWIVLMAGPGHLENNLMKTIIDYCWDVFLDQLAESLGYKTPIAQKVFRNVSDFHKGYDACVAIRHALAAELVTPYILQTSLAGTQPTLHDFSFYVKNAKNKNFSFIFAILNNFFESLHLYRFGIRTNNSTAVTAALKTSLVPFFCVPVPIIN